MDAFNTDIGFLNIYLKCKVGNFVTIWELKKVKVPNWIETIGCNFTELNVVAIKQNNTRVSCYFLHWIVFTP